MSPARALIHLACAAVLAPFVLACCFFGGAPPAPSAAPEPTVAPLPTPLGAHRVATPLPPPATTGVIIPVLAHQLAVEVTPAIAAARPPAADGPPIPGMLGGDRLELEPEGALAAVVVDLPCTPSADLAAGAAAELARRVPALAGQFTARPFAVADPTLRVVELLPDVPSLGEDNAYTLAWLAIDLGTHVGWLSIERGMLADGQDTAGLDDAARARAEAVLQTLRRGDATFDAHIGRSTYGDLFDHITAPEGWVARAWSCCDEDPPYVALLRESVIPMRALGGAPRARVSARSGSRCLGTPGPSGTMHGRPMRWTRTVRDLCWVDGSSATPDAPDAAITWHVRGASDADLAEALTVVATASRED